MKGRRIPIVVAVPLDKPLEAVELPGSGGLLPSSLFDPSPEGWALPTRPGLPAIECDSEVARGSLDVTPVIEGDPLREAGSVATLPMTLDKVLEGEDGDTGEPETKEGTPLPPEATAPGWGDPLKGGGEPLPVPVGLGLPFPFPPPAGAGVGAAGEGAGVEGAPPPLPPPPTLPRIGTLAEIPGTRGGARCFKERFDICVEIVLRSR